MTKQSKEPLPEFPNEEAAPEEVEVVSPTEKQMRYTLDKIEGVIDEQKQTAIAAKAKVITSDVVMIRFKNRPMVEDYTGFPHFVPLHKERFDKEAYLRLGGIPRSQVSDVYAYVCSTVEDFTNSQHLIGFGVPIEHVEIEADTDLVALHSRKPTVWDMRELRYDIGLTINDTVWRSPYCVVSNGDGKDHQRIPFIMQLAGDDEGLYDDIMQSIAPIIMDQKPDGVVWWVGSGANGKSTLMDAIYRIFPGQLASITVRRLVDGRDTPSLNGTLANIVKESSEGRVDDTETYKALGTHENFRVHKFHSQDDIEINGNIHTIFSANTIPIFNDKGYSARRRTFIIPFNQQFKSDPEFEKNTFTPEFFGRLISEMCRYAKQIERQGYQYKWSAATRAAKMDYDNEANNAEEYAKKIINEGVVGYYSYNSVRMDYENWCSDEGYVPLGIGNLRKAMGALGFERTTTSAEDGKSAHVYRLKGVTGSLGQLGMGRPGLLTVDGFNAMPIDKQTPEQQQTSILGKKW
jgi:hypothetical protein